MSKRASINREDLYKDYILDNRSVRYISKKYKTDYKNIYKHLNDYNIEIRKTYAHIGEKQGKLLIIDREFKNPTGDHCYYLCKCDCGNTKWIHYTTLIKNKVMCCGCSDPNKHNYVLCGEIKRACWNIIVRTAKNANHDFNITPEQVWDLYLKQDRKCYYTGIALDFKYKANNKDMNASIDRIDNTKGYEVDNIRIVHKAVNITRGAAEHNAFVYICNKVVENHKCNAEDLNKKLIMKPRNHVLLE